MPGSENSIRNRGGQAMQHSADLLNRTGDAASAFVSHVGEEIDNADDEDKSEGCLCYVPLLLIIVHIRAAAAFFSKPRIY